MRHLSQYTRGYRREIILAPFFKCLEALFELSVPLVIAHLVDKVIPHRDDRGVIVAVVVMVLLASLGVGIAIIAQYFSAKVAVGISGSMSQSLFQKVLSLDQSVQDQLTRASLVNRLTADMLQIRTGINLFLRLFLRAPIIVCGAIVMAFQISSTLTLSFLVMLVCLVALIYGSSLILSPLMRQLRQTFDTLTSKTREQITGIKVIRAFNRSNDELDTLHRITERLYHEQLLTARLSSLLSPLTFLTVNLTLVVLLLRGKSLIAVDLLSQGMVIALMNYLSQILVELLKTTALIHSLNQALISLKRISHVFDLPSRSHQLILPVHASPQDVLIVNALTFTYPSASEPALEGISCRLKRGEHLGIIGGTGSGKSTLLQLLSNAYQGNGGELILFDERGLSPETPLAWQQLVSVVPQKGGLFTGTIRFNLTLGISKTLDDEMIWEALEVAQAAEFVRRLPGMLDYRLSTSGASLSGGQGQRLMIARALLMDRPFLLLDDATSALDYVTESRLLSSVMDYLGQRTLIMVSQRVRTLVKCHQILILDEGRQMAYGTHDDLLLNSSLYQDIYRSQLSFNKGEEYVS